MRQNRRPAMTYDLPTKRGGRGGIVPAVLLGLGVLVATFALAAALLGGRGESPSAQGSASPTASATPVGRTTPQGALAMLWDAWSLPDRPQREEAMASVCQPNLASMLSAQQLKARPVGDPKITPASFGTNVEQRMSDKTTLRITLMPDGDDWTVQAVAKS